MAYNYRKKYKDDYDYRPDFRQDYGFNNYKYDDEYSYSDYTTSAISYGESLKRPRFASPLSKSEEYGHESRRHSPRESQRRKSPSPDYADFTQDDAIKKRSKKTRNDIKNVFYQFEIEKGKHKQNERASRYLRRGDYNDNVIDEPDVEYVKYFEKTRIKEKKPKKHTNDNTLVEDRKKNEKQSDNQEYSYKERKLHKHKKFRSKGKDRERSPASSEIEIGNVDYPVLAFKNNSPKNASSTLIFLPLVCKEEESKIQGNAKAITKPNQAEDKQVYTTDVSGNKNIFSKEKNKVEKDLKNQAVLELQTEESVTSRDTKLRDESNAKTSIETQTEDSSIFEHTYPTTQSYKTVGSILGNVLEKAGLKSKLKDNCSSKGSRKHKPYVENKKLFSYEIDVDIEPVAEQKFFRSKISKVNPNNTSHQIEYKEIEVEDPLHDDYPVTKDYIKVSDENSLKNNPITIKTTDVAETSDGSISATNPINYKRQKMFEVKDSISGSKNEPRDQLRVMVQKESHDSSMEHVQGGIMSHLRPQDIKVYRSTVNEGFKKSTLQRSSVAPQGNKPTDNLTYPDNVSNNILLDDILQSISKEQRLSRVEGKVSEIHEEPLINQRNSRRDSSVIRPNRDSSVARKRSVARESGVNKKSKDTSFIDGETRKPSVVDQRKSTLKPTMSRKKSNVHSIAVEPENTIFQSENPILADNVDEFPRKSPTQTLIKDQEYMENERKSGISPSKKSQMKENLAKKKSGIFSRKSKIETEKKESGVRQKSMAQSKPKSDPQVEQYIQAEENEYQPPKTQSQRSLDVRKSKRQTLAGKDSPRSKSQKSLEELPRTKSQKSLEELPQDKSKKSQKELPRGKSQVERTKSKSKVWGFLRPSKAKEGQKTSSTAQEPTSQKQRSEHPYPARISSETSIEAKKKQDNQGKDKEESNKEENKDAKQCECIVQYVNQARECGHFFLGTTLHEQIIDILKTV